MAVLRLYHVGGWVGSSSTDQKPWPWKSPETDSHYRTLGRLGFGGPKYTWKWGWKQEDGLNTRMAKKVYPESLLPPYEAEQPPFPPCWWSLVHSNSFSELSLSAIHLLQTDTSFIFQHFPTSKNPVSACIQIRPSMFHRLVYFLIEFWNLD